MAVPDGALQFQLFYVSFLLITLFLIGLYQGSETILTGLDQAKIDRLKNVETLDDDPGILGYAVYPFQVLYDWINKAIVLAQISSGLAFLELLLTAFTFIELFIMVGMVRS